MDGTYIVLTKDYCVQTGVTYFRAGTLGIVRRGDGLLTPNYCWVEFPNLPKFGNQLQGTWVCPHHLEIASLLEVVGGGCTDTGPTSEEHWAAMKEVKKQVRLARAEQRGLRRKERARVRRARRGARV